MLAAGAAFVDIELATWKRCRLAGTNAFPADRVILSCHDFEKRPADPEHLLDELLAIPGIVPKIAWKPTDIRDGFLALHLARQASRPIIAICMGEEGILSRVLASTAGMFATYCAPDDGTPTAPGQIRRSEMILRYRWPRLNPETRFFGVIGDPVSHSLGPLIHNGLFEQAGLNAVYLPLRVADRDNVLAGFLDLCQTQPEIHPGGFSVTIPHKIRAMACLGNRVTEHARRIGAVNTVTCIESGYYGTNTDYHGVLRALAEGLGCEPDFLEGIPVDVLGSGGVARAVVAALSDIRCQITIFARNREKASRLAADFAPCCRACDWDDRGASSGRILVNCTPLGMWPESDQSPYPPQAIARYAAVFDTVYNPVKTRLLADAAAAGCKTISGVSMFIHQAAAQFELWTNTTPDRLWMTEQVLTHLDSHE